MDLYLDNKYRKQQVNGTIYVTTNDSLLPEQLMELEAGAGELFLTCITRGVTADDIMQVALELGDVFQLRFKIEFSGESRGYAYLQYIELEGMQRALNVLQHLFRQHKLKVKVRESRNRKMLFLNSVDHLKPLQVYQELRSVCRYEKLSVFEYLPNQFVYIILYRNNDEAALAHHTLRTKMGLFGVNGYIGWLDRRRSATTIDELPNCCVELKRSECAAFDCCSCCCFRV